MTDYRTRTGLIAAICILVGATTLLLKASQPGPSNQVLPQKKHSRQSGSKTSSAAQYPSGRLKHSCTISTDDFNKWFANGKASKNGVVTPANSLKDPFNNDCDFYLWAWRMFLWQTSPLPNNGGPVFNSAPFFDLADDNQLISTKQSRGGGVKRVRGGKPTQIGAVGQAGKFHGVLMSQPGMKGAKRPNSLVYYGIHVNDVYAYMASGVNSGAIQLSTFPTKQEQLTKITDYAKAHYDAAINDGQTLAMELKSSWVRADSLVDVSSYITVKSNIPKYTKKNDTTWTWDGETIEKDVLLACVGYHLVGSVAGHPEMVWATFEHVENAPDADYYYINAQGQTVLRKNWNDKGNGPPIHKNWLFMNPGKRRQSTNVPVMTTHQNDIVATRGNKIGPSSTSRTNPWGNPPTEASAENNTRILSLNDSIRSLLGKYATGDPRANYVLIGATWTNNGVPGASLQIPEVVGSKKLANSTMETYFQFNNCFGCHKGSFPRLGNNLKNNGKPQKIIGLSHIFGKIKPLSRRIISKAKENSVTLGGSAVNVQFNPPLQPGDVLSISTPITDAWDSGGGFHTTNADGAKIQLGPPISVDWSQVNTGSPLKHELPNHRKNANLYDFAIGGLVGSTDNGTTFFPVGTAYSGTILNKNVSDLNLYFWDVNSGDNSGSVTATLRVMRRPRR